MLNRSLKKSFNNHIMCFFQSLSWKFFNYILIVVEKIIWCDRKVKWNNFPFILFGLNWILASNHVFFYLKNRWYLIEFRMLYNLKSEGNGTSYLNFQASTSNSAKKKFCIKKNQKFSKKKNMKRNFNHNQHWVIPGTETQWVRSL